MGKEQLMEEVYLVTFKGNEQYPQSIKMKLPIFDENGDEIFIGMKSIGCCFAK